MMAHDIPAMADEHRNYPDESRDDLVARYIESALPTLHAMGQDMPIEKLAQIAGRIVDYVEAHSAPTGTHNPADLCAPLRNNSRSFESCLKAYGVTAETWRPEKLHEQFMADCTSFNW